MHSLILFAALLAVLLGLGVAYVYGRFGRHLQGGPAHALPPGRDETEIDRLAVSLLDEHRGQNGITLIADNIDAFAARVVSARRAGRSLDLQYYYWKNDLTGKLLTREIIAAADRGVRVRLLLDDINAGLHDRMCLSLDAHENIEVRLFNPSRARTDRLRRGLEMMLRPLSATRRMHNKAWIADGHVAITGGRNIGDAYFDADEQANFRDLDVWMLGPVVDEAAAMFDQYWNSPVVLPIGALRTPRRHYLPQLRYNLETRSVTPAAKHYLDEVERDMAAGGLYAGEHEISWTTGVRLVCDPPEKAHLQKRQNWIMRELLPVLTAAKHDIRIISPYFIPGQQGTARIAELASRNVTVSVLTNSLAATDVAAVHGAYAPYRKPLLRSGVTLFELKAIHAPGERKRMSLFGSRGASLHTKAFTVDGETGFVGSMNFDPRSASLNTEMGMLFTHPALVEGVNALFAEETRDINSFRLQLSGSRIEWYDREDGEPRRLKREPEAGFLRRLIASVIRILPIESQL
ncbi:putative cardiolipin synthase [Pararhizobium capsulatum DSM 1112]|uniref:Phospholipase D n=1 Tax=Pararhizobium capsulatum DSM 1112 TaxID=1121113 RepID=A0ABU0BQ71_9HYPH|nr:phospholipase D family protein [Pararhizobium capsulatum]MDQ0319884.1 putative cardiolipin synthase [Pararhizobium capsulatum DSM 1112]